MKNKKRFTFIEGAKSDKQNVYDAIEEEEERLKELGKSLMDNILDIIEEKCSEELRKKITSEIQVIAEKDWGKVDVGKDFIGSILDIIRENCPEKQSEEIIDEIFNRPNPTLWRPQ